MAEGTTVADVDGDGKPEIVSGPYIYSMPDGGPYSGDLRAHGFFRDWGQ